MLHYKTVSLHKPFLFFCFILFFSVARAQFAPKNYPRGYFTYPVQATIGLAANFGELRPNHYHMGYDCRTDQHQNARVVAAADGFISHVKIEPFGFGRAIYIEHPNGLTTVYGHLNNFTPELEKYVKEQQYAKESWQVFLDIPANRFPVKKGEFIAFSGNTGGSQGPHLHFEIRNTKTDKVLNPSLFGFPIPDDVPPTLTRLAMYDRFYSTYSQSPRFFAVKKTGSGSIDGASLANYSITAPLIVANTDRISFGISAVDRYTGSANPNGIYEAMIYFDDLSISGFQLDNISYDETRYLNAHIDHTLRAGGGPFVEHLSRLPGYPPGIYKDFESDGTIYLEDDSVHQVRVEVKDAYGNASVLRFAVKRGFVNENRNAVLSAQKFVPGYVNIFERDDIQVTMNENNLYDTVDFVYAKKMSATPKAASPLHMVHTAAVPVQGYFSIRLKKDAVAVNDSRLIIQRSWGAKTDVAKATPSGDGWYMARFRDFGNFQLVEDDVPPVIGGGIKENADLSRAARIIFTVTDNYKEINNFRAVLDGKWLRFTNDKGRSFIYQFDEMCGPGAHELVVSVEDEAGNKAVRAFHFTR